MLIGYFNKGMIIRKVNRNKKNGNWIQEINANLTNSAKFLPHKFDMIFCICLMKLLLYYSKLNLRAKIFTSLSLVLRICFLNKWIFISELHSLAVYRIQEYLKQFNVCLCNKHKSFELEQSTAAFHLFKKSFYKIDISFDWILLENLVLRRYCKKIFKKMSKLSNTIKANGQRYFYEFDWIPHYHLWVNKL